MNSMMNDINSQISNNILESAAVKYATQTMQDETLVVVRNILTDLCNDSKIMIDDVLNAQAENIRNSVIHALADIEGIDKTNIASFINTNNSGIIESVQSCVDACMNDVLNTYFKHLKEEFIVQNSTDCDISDRKIVKMIDTNIKSAVDSIAKKIRE